MSPNPKNPKKKRSKSKRGEGFGSPFFIVMENTAKRNCDKCACYTWYYDFCRKWECEVDGREVHGCFESRANESQAKNERASK